jgi:tRNA threonylcarbamoyladenosine biosynthesis protein TsaB
VRGIEKERGFVMMQPDLRDLHAPGGSLLLALDTSSSTMGAALLADTRLVVERSNHAERDHSVRLLPMIEDMLANAGVHPGELSAIAAGVGPGSYTGVRIGVTVAKTMAWARQVPVAGVSSLAALALSALLPDGGTPAAVNAPHAGEAPLYVVPLVNARRGQAYTALFRIGPAPGTILPPADALQHREDRSDGGYPGGNQPVAFAQAWESGHGWAMARLEADRICLVDAWLEQLRQRDLASELPPARLVFTGETAGFLPQITAFAERRQAETLLVAGELRAYAVGLLASPALRAGATSDPHELLPNYTQLAEAEVRLAARLRGEANA